jgi:uncharacterized membrane protein (UPF0127 family)
MMSLFRPYCRPLLAGALVLLAVSAEAAPPVVSLTLPSGRVINVELMINDQDRALGLMFRPSLPADRGVLLVFRGSGFHGIWMKNCRFPIDIIWLDEERRVVHVAENVPPCKADPCPSYEPLRRASYVLEVNAGQAREDEATVGATLSFELPR